MGPRPLLVMQTKKGLFSCDVSDIEQERMHTAVTRDLNAYKFTIFHIALHKSSMINRTKHAV